MATSGNGVLRELIAVFGFGVDTHELKDGESALESFVGKLRKIAGAVAGLFAIHEIAEFANQQAELLDHIDDTANALGISTERVQEFRFAAKALGDDGDALLHMLGRMQVTQQAAAAGSQQAAQAFSSIGVSVRDTNGQMKAADQLFLDVADKIADTKDASKAAAIATTLFGREGRKLLPFLKEGKAGFAELVAEYKELGGGYTKEAIEEGAKFQREQARLGLATTGLKNVIAIQLFPVLDVLIRNFTKVVAWLREVTKHSSIVQAMLAVLGAAASVFAIKMAIANAPLILMATIIGGLILLVDDFLTMMEGGDSLIGDFIDKIAGKDAHLEVVKQLKELWVDVGGAIKVAWDYAKQLFEGIEKYSGYLGDLLGRASNAAVEATSYDEGEVKAAARQRQRIEAAKVGQLYRAPGENVVQAEAARAELIQRGLVPGAPSVRGAPSNTTLSQVTVHQTINPSPGMDEKLLGEHAAKAIGEATKQERRAAAATFQRKAPE